MNDHIRNDHEDLLESLVGGSRPEDEVTVKPYDPFGFQHHSIHRKEPHYKGDHVPEEESSSFTPAADTPLFAECR
jgi:hypothetical protein